MQATVETYDRATATGSVLTDEGKRLAFGHNAVTGGHLRHLRPGQRVHLEVDAEDTVIDVRIF